MFMYKVEEPCTNFCTLDCGLRMSLRIRFFFIIVGKAVTLSRHTWELFSFYRSFLIRIGKAVTIGLGANMAANIASEDTTSGAFTAASEAILSGHRTVQTIRRL